jgi:hypothetical protein
MRRIITCLAVVLLTDLLISCGGPRSGFESSSRALRVRPSHFGITLPYPKKVPAYAGDSLPPVAGAELLVPLNLSVNAKGKVKSVTAEFAGDSAFAIAGSRFFRALKFVPGLRNGKRDSMTVRLLLQVGGTGSEPLVHFPVGPDCQVDEAELYWAALARLGYRPACLRRFESYYYLLNKNKLWQKYEYKVFQVDLDSAGDVVGVELIKATTPHFNDQIKTAINWGEYEPMTIDGRPVASSNFLVVLLLPTINYPTLPLDFRKTDTYNVWDRLRVRLMPDTLGVLAPPIPRREWSTEISHKFLSGMIPDLVSGRIRVDTTGISRIDNVSSDFWKARRILHLNAFEIPFFPALDFSGRSRVWSGLVFLKYTSDTTAHAWFDWDRSAGSSAACGSTDPN